MQQLYQLLWLLLWVSLLSAAYLLWAAHLWNIGRIGKCGISVVDRDKRVIKLIFKYRNNKLAQVKTQKKAILWLHGNWQIWSYLP